MLPRRPALQAVRSLATEVGAANNTLHAPTPPLSTTKSAATRSKPLLEAAVIVNRSPTITRSPSRFEKTFFQYQSRIARALHNPFPYEFYFKQGSPLEAQFNIEERSRERQAFGRLTRTMWDTTEANLEAAKLAKEEVGKRATRFTEADKRKDLRSLDRRGERNLYLVTKSEDSSWSFPRAAIRKGEFLHQTAERALYPHCGVNVDTWLVGRKPIGLYKPVEPTEGHERLVFFYKMHILAGQVEPNGSSAVDFAWLTKEEIKGYVEREYWRGVKDMLSDS